MTPPPPALPDLDDRDDLDGAAPFLPADVDDARARHWRRTLRLTAVLLLAWFVVGFGAVWFARDLDFPFFGWPFSFWVAAQGGVLVFVALIAVYAWRMARHDHALAAAGGLPAPDVARRGAWRR